VQLYGLEVSLCLGRQLPDAFSDLLDEQIGRQHQNDQHHQEWSPLSQRPDLKQFSNLAASL